MDDLVRSAGRVETVDDFKNWIRKRVRPLLPHQALACGCGHLHAAGFTMDYVVTVDYPLDHLTAIRNRAGGIDTPLLRHWLQTRAPVLFDAEVPWPGVSEQWLENFQRHSLLNAAAHGVYEQERCVGTYFSFHRLPKPLGSAQRSTLSAITPVLHQTLLSVTEKLQQCEAPPPGPLSGLAPREREVCQLIGEGKTNRDIALLFGLSENTIKHHVTALLKKTGVANRAQLALLSAELDLKSHQRNGTKVL